MREVEVHVWCDPHRRNEDMRVPGREHRLTIGGKELVVDLCDPCYLAMLKPALDLFANFGTAHEGGQPEAEARRGVKPLGERHWRCLWCERDFASDSGLIGHVDNQHAPVKRISDIVGTRCPLCDAKHGTLTRHAQVAHGLSNATDLFHQAKEFDPYGVVAERLALAR